MALGTVSSFMWEQKRNKKEGLCWDGTWDFKDLSLGVCHPHAPLPFCVCYFTFILHMVGRGLSQEFVSKMCKYRFLNHASPFPKSLLRLFLGTHLNRNKKKIHKIAIPLVSANSTALVPIYLKNVPSHSIFVIGLN